MLTDGEIQATATALDGARAEVERAEQAAGGWTVVGFLSGADDSRSKAAASARALYTSLVDLRQRAIDSPDPEHELALQVVEVGNRLAGRGTASSIVELKTATEGSTIVANAWTAAVDRTTQIMWIAVAGVVVGLILILFARKGD